jgi:elongation factor G
VSQSQRANSAKVFRNIAFVGHAGGGKTSLIETLLAQSGATHSIGRVDNGTTVSDFTDQEKRLKHSLNVSVCNLEQDGCRVNLLDTPGYPDFLGRSLAILRAVETAAVVVNAQHGVEIVAQRAMQAAADLKLCRLIVVNKIDVADTDLAGVLEQIREIFGPACLPLNLPAREGQAVADCFFEPADETPDFSTVADAHTKITEQVIELDDELMEQYLEQGEEISLEQLHDPFERALRRGHLVPVCFVSAETRAGLRQLLRVFTQLMPSPLEGNPAEFVRGASEDNLVKVDPSGIDDHFIAHVFKVAVDPYVGRVAHFRVHQGQARTGQDVYIGDNRQAVKLAHIYRVQGKSLTEIPAAVAGDFCAVSKIDEIQYDDVLHSSHDEDELRMRDVDSPEPMYGVALELVQHGQEKKLSDALHKLVAEDPSLRIEHNMHANETVLKGMGELHLRLVLERIKEDFGIELTTRPPKIDYRETITRAAEGHHRHKKQTGGAGQFGEVFLRVEPLAPGEGFEFVNKVVGGSIPGQFIPAVEKGVRDVIDHGAVTGHRMQDLRVIVYDGKHHSVDSKEVAFVMAGKKAFIDAVSKAGPKLLEPIAKIDVTAPSKFVGDITGHLAGIRAKIVGNDSLPGNQAKISAEVPIAELADYQTTLKSLTGGEGSFTLVLDHYEAAPAQVQAALEKEYRPSIDS